MKATLSLDTNAAGTALLAIGFVDNNGGQGADSESVAPPGPVSVEVDTNAGTTGILRVVVDFNTNSDIGRLLVQVDGAVRNDEPIIGDTTWAYSLT